MTQTPEISAILPVFNEKDNLRPVLAELLAVLRGLQQPFEVIFVNDGSTDGSADEIRKLQQEYECVRWIDLDGNHGQTAAFDAGFKAAQGAVVITLDSDGQNDPADIPALLGQLANFDVAVGWRRNRQDNWVRKISSRVANSFRAYMTRDGIRDIGCSLKIFKREVVTSFYLFEGMHRFLPTLAKINGYTVAEVAVNHRPRQAGKSKYNVFNRLWKSLKDLYAVRWMSQRKLRYCSTEHIREGGELSRVNDAALR